MKHQKQYRFLGLIFLFYSAAFAQESVEVPQILQKDVHAFKLTIDSLKILTEGLHARASAVLNELQLVQEKMALLTPGSRNYLLERRRYEEKLSQYLSQNYATLQEMQTLRLETLASLENIVTTLEQNDNTGATALEARIGEQVRLNKDRITNVKLEMVRILDELKKQSLTDARRAYLNKKFHRLRNDRLALHEQNAVRLSQLLSSAGKQDGELPGVLRSLAGMRETLRDGFDWLETEMAYISLYAQHRKKRLAIDARLVEVTGLVERFNDFVAQINTNSDILRQVESFDRHLNTEADGISLLPGISRLKWPGQPEMRANTKILSQAEIDSLRKALKKQLKK